LEANTLAYLAATLQTKKTSFMIFLNRKTFLETFGLVSLFFILFLISFHYMEFLKQGLALGDWSSNQLAVFTMPQHSA
jgi:hypothetical protein